MKFRVQNLFLEDIHLILFLPKISCASTKLSTQLSETVEEPFSSDITRTHHYNSAILNNVARSSALGTTLRDVCVSMSTRKCFCDTTLPEFGQECKASRYKAFTKYTYTFQGRSLNKELLASFFLMLVKVCFLPPDTF